MESEQKKYATKATVLRGQSGTLQSILLFITTFLIGFFPLLVIPQSFITITHGKAIITAIFLVFFLLLYGLHLFYSRSVRLHFGLGVTTLIFFSICLALPAFFAQNLYSAGIGTFFGLTSVLSSLMVVFVGLATFFFSNRPTFIRNILIFLLASVVTAVLLQWTKVIGVFFGVDLVSFLPSVTTTVVGSWNTLGLLVLLTLTQIGVALLCCNFTRLTVIMLSLISCLMVATLFIINVGTIWILTGVVAVILYGLHVLKQGDSLSKIYSLSMLAVSIVGFLTIVHVGSFLQKFGVSYVEIQPSIGAVYNTGSQLFMQDSGWLGAGPGNFSDVWHKYKPAEIMPTIFWDQSFEFGGGYWGTLIIENGIFAIFAIFGLLTSFIYSVIDFFRRFHAAVPAQKFSGISSMLSVFVLALGLTIVLPTITLLVLLFVFLGMFWSTYFNIRNPLVIRVNTRKNRVVRTSIVVVSISCMFLAASLGALLFNHYIALASVNEAVRTAEDSAVVDDALRASFQRNGDAHFAYLFAERKVSALAELLQAESTDSNQQKFINSLQEGIAVIDVAIQLQPQKSEYLFTKAKLQLIAAEAGINEVVADGLETVSMFELLYPQSPKANLIAASLLVTSGDTEAAITEAKSALDKKPNYAPISLFLAQTALQANDIDAAIKYVENLLAFDSRNQNLYYELSLLYIKANKREKAKEALSVVLQMDPTHANANYLLAIMLIEDKSYTEALSLLKVVLEYNPDNTSVQSAVAALERGDYSVFEQPPDVNLPEAVIENNEGVDTPTADDVSSTEAVTTVNTPTTGGNDTPADDGQIEGVSAEQGNSAVMQP